MVFDTHSSDAAPHEILSDREFQVLHLLAAGKSINAIAEVLVLSAKTISTHKMRLMQKLGIENNAELIRYAIKHGLTSERDGS
jgi:DNA-binding NarL/FixJ family response regulator